ncbi:LD-carboxypeptidase [Micromonospora sp. WMMD980]|uniref:S66 peptidase family protein n=1 Tax=Micromonospora sp. WMMD980 TaxID=3016088 RepID=UPI0024164DE1|nr:LD-carboxypeptidase [Micromonospora sp. WMMD980]MDG4803712.1 LD-carboxypeptidase [Micromonospora sp. WMMD980]
MRVVAPASPPIREDVARGVQLLTSWGLQVEVGAHVFDRWGYMAGRDEDRAADLNDAFHDPGVRAIVTARGGKGAYRIVDDLDFVAARQDPKPLVGFSDISHLHLALWTRAGLASLHGPFANSPARRRSTGCTPSFSGSFSASRTPPTIPRWVNGWQHQSAIPLWQTQRHARVERRPRHATPAQSA